MDLEQDRTNAAHQTSAPLVELRNVTKEFDRATRGRRSATSESLVVLEDIDLQVETGEFVALVGPSGCGKSTILNLVAGLLQATSGSVFYRGMPVRKVNTQVGYVTQYDSLLPWRTVRFNIEIPLIVRNVAKDERDTRVDEMIRAVGLEGFADAFPSALSGGMRSRAMIARTLVYEPEALLMDEPFAALDALLRLEMQEELLQLWSRTSALVMYVTHDIDEAVALADRILVFSRLPARVIAVYHILERRPRDVRKDPAFGRIHDEIWQTLRGEIL